MEDVTKGNPETGTRPRRNNTWIYVLIIVLLLATNIYLFLNKDNNQHKYLEVIQKLEQVDSSFAILEDEYKASLARLDDLTGKNSQLERQLRQKDSELNQTKQRIQDILAKGPEANAAELSEARLLITELNTKIRSYERQITQLRRTNTALKAERDSIASTNASLQQKVDLAKVLHASNIRLKAIDLRRGGRKEKETEKAKRVDLLRITFDIDENRIAEDGTKELHICIINPHGELLNNPALGSGSFKDTDGKSKYYSVAKQVDLNNEQPLHDINVDWLQTAVYEKGAYSVEIYHQGYLIGKGSVNLR
jgi:uncharacterized protein YoxC